MKDDGLIRPRKFITGVLWLCIVVGIGCRFTGLNWDSGFHLHPDERFLTMTATALGWPQSVSEYFDTARAPLNPFNGHTDFFVYGQLPVFLVKALAAITGKDSYDDLVLVGRIVSACFDTLTIFLVFLIVRKTGGVLLGSLAAAFFSLIALNIQHAHFFVVDTFAATFLVAAFYFALQAFEKNASWQSALWCGLCLGAACACKISSLLFIIAIIVILLINAICKFFQRGHLCHSERNEVRNERNEVEESGNAGRNLRLEPDSSTALTRSSFAPLGMTRKKLHKNLHIALTRREGKARLAPALMIFGTAFCAFRIFHPIAFRGEGEVLTLWGLLDVRPHPQFWNALSYQQKITSGEIDVPFNLQWFERAPYLWPLENLGDWAVGWPLVLSTLAALCWLATRVLRREATPPPLYIAALWTVFVFLFYGAQFSKFTRYYLVVTPFIALMAAWLWLELWRHSKTRVLKIATLAATGGVLGYGLLWSLAVTSIFTRPHPRVAASQWIARYITPGTTIANETAWDEGMPLQGMEYYRVLDLKLFERDDAVKRAYLLDALEQTDWIFVSSPRAWKTIPRLPQRFPMTGEYYRALFDGRLGFEKAAEFTSYPQLFDARFFDEEVEEALHVYTHPRVMLFRKTDRYSTDNAARILSPN